MCNLLLERSQLTKGQSFTRCMSPSTICNSYNVSKSRHKMGEIGVGAHPLFQESKRNRKLRHFSMILSVKLQDETTFPYLILVTRRGLSTLFLFFFLICKLCQHSFLPSYSFLPLCPHSEHTDGSSLSRGLPFCHSLSLSQEM